MLLNEAEKQLITLLRHEDTKNFTVTIRTNGGYWYAFMEDYESELRRDGAGESFETAWNGILDQD